MAPPTLLNGSSSRSSDSSHMRSGRFDFNFAPHKLELDVDYDETPRNPVASSDE